jgi:hypothetical protein
MKLTGHFFDGIDVNKIKRNEEDEKDERVRKNSNMLFTFFFFWD